MYLSPIRAQGQWSSIVLEQKDKLQSLLAHGGFLGLFWFFLRCFFFFLNSLQRAEKMYGFNEN